MENRNNANWSINSPSRRRRSVSMRNVLETLTPKKKKRSKGLISMRMSSSNLLNLSERRPKSQTDLSRRKNRKENLSKRSSLLDFTTRKTSEQRQEELAYKIMAELCNFEDQYICLGRSLVLKRYNCILKGNLTLTYHTIVLAERQFGIS